MWKNDTEVYETIGRFTVGFEHVCRAMETCVRNILDGEGLENHSMQEILLAGMTAEPLATLLQRLVGQKFAVSDKEKVISSCFFNELRDLIEERNDLIHAKWFLVGMGAKEEEQEIRAFGEKLHARKVGTATKNLSLDKSKLEKLLGDCREASIRLSLLSRCVIGVRSLTECFEVKNKKLLVNYEMLKPIVAKL